MKSLYYQFINFIQTMHPCAFIMIWFLLLAWMFSCIMKFFKSYNGTQKNFEKLSKLVLAIILFVIVFLLATIRK